VSDDIEEGLQAGGGVFTGINQRVFQIGHINKNDGRFVRRLQIRNNTREPEKTDGTSRMVVFRRQYGKNTTQRKVQDRRNSKTQVKRAIFVNGVKDNHTGGDLHEIGGGKFTGTG